MADPSYLRFIPSSCADIPVDWTKMPEKAVAYFKRCWCNKWSTDEELPLPQTISELGERLHESRFFGYLEPERCDLLLDISEFGLANAQPADTPSGPQHSADTKLANANGCIAGPANNQARAQVWPRFYMRYLEQIWFILFIPGTRHGIIGHSPQLPEEDLDVVNPDDWTSPNSPTGQTEKVMAEVFDLKLIEELQGTTGEAKVAMVDMTRNMAGWEASSIQSSLEYAQLANAMMSLPRGHFARIAFLEGFFDSLKNRLNY